MNEYLSKEKHPEELANAQRDLSVLHGVQTHDNITRDNLLQIQEKVSISALYLFLHNSEREKKLASLAITMVSRKY